MKRMLKAWMLALAVLVGVQAESRPVGPAGAAPSHGGVCRHLSRKGAFGRIAMQAGNDHAFPEGAEISMSRTRSDDVKRKIHQGWSKRKGFGSKRGPAGGSGVSPLQPPSVLASYDISIRHGGKKWQPAAGDPVRVTVELDEPVPVTDISTLGVAHLSDDGTVEELPASRRGFTLNAAKTAVTAFWFKATGFSVYAIVDNGEGNDPGRRLYGFFSLQNDDTTYAPHYFTTQAGNRSYRQIVKSGEMLLEPEALPSPAGLTFMGWFLYDAAKANTEGYDANGYATTPFDFSQPIVFDTLGEEEFALRAVFAHNAHVIFHEQPIGTDWPITAVRRGQLTQNASTGKWEASIPIDDMTVTYDDSKEEEHSNATPKMIFRGWSLVPVTPGSLTNVLGEAIHLESSPLAVTLDTISSTTLGPTHLYPVFVNINWITYKAGETGQGATYIPPKYFYQDEGTNSCLCPVRTGYVFDGWWTGTNTGFQVATSTGALNTGNLPTTAEAAAAEGAWGGYVKNGKLMLAKDVMLYGRWVKGNAKYTVAVFRQSLNDDKDTVNKTYDFAFSVTNSAQTESSVSVDNIFKQLETQVASSINQGREEAITTADFKGFFYSTCDDAQTVKGNGTTVLRVYYDRYRVSYLFRKSGTTGYYYTTLTAEPYIYTATDLDYYTYTATSLDYYTYTQTTADRYTYTQKYSSGSNGRTNKNNYDVDVSLDYWGYGGRVNGTSVGGYTKVYPVLSGNYYYWSINQNSSNDSYRYKNGTIYARSVNNVTQYGVSNGNYFELEYSDANGRWENRSTGAAYTGTRYTRAQTANLPTLYGLDGDGYFELEYVNGEWQNSETGDAYTGTRYTRTQNYAGDVYGTENNTSPYEVTPFVVSYEDGNWCTNGVEYAGTRYTRELNDVGEVYGTNNGASPYSGTPFRIYFVNDAWRTSNSASGTVYTGTRYVRVASSGSNYAPSSDVDDPCMTGLYGQPLSKYGYEWPSAYQWGVEGGGVNMTYLETFNYVGYAVKDSTAHTMNQMFNQSGNQGNSVIYHVLQGLDGTYSMANAITNLCSGGNFNFTDKFEGFSVYGFSERNFTSNPANNASVNGRSNGTYPLYVYHQRKKFTLTLCDSYNLNVFSVHEVYYGAPLSGYKPPVDPTPTEQSMKAGYTCSGWYSDQATSTKFNFNTTMPRNNLIAYAGWGTEWYLIQIDPNGGELAPGQSDWFWEPYNGDPIEEYATTTRSYTEAYDGTWFYAKKDRAFYGLTDEWDPIEDDISDRGVYYTQDQSDPAIVDANKRYTGPVQSVYRYAGWYEVHEDGSEELYAFGQPVQHNTLLRLHWKHIGTYRLVYHAGAGTMSNGDENETETFTLLDSSVYADSSEVLVTRTADAPAGYYFVGWKIRHADDTLYRPGQTFKFNSGYTTSVPGADGTTVRQLVLDAVYEKVTTVSLKFDANGGTVSGGGENAFALDYENAPVAFTNVSGNAITVSGMRNNAYGTVGDGSGFSCTVDGEQLEFLGWNTAPDGTGTHFDPGALIGLDVDGTVDENGVNTLYAEWGVKVYFNINNPDGLWNETAWPENYVWDEEKHMFYQMVVLNGYASDPEVPLTSTDPDDMFYYWGEKRYSDEVTEFDFSQPITTATLTLYAFWSDRIDVAVHAVDTTQGARTDKDEWLTAPSILMNVDTVKSFETDADGCVTVPEGYAFAFACVSDSHANVSEDFAITNLYYDMHEKHVYVTYANGESGPLPDDKEIYFVYFESPLTLGIGYKVMEMNGSLRDASVRSTVVRTVLVEDGDTGAYDVSASLTTPKGYLSGETLDSYAYAIGEPDATGVLQLHFITTTSSSDSARPALRIRNTWRGYQYSTDGGETWIGYGYNAHLYVVYFNYQPVVVSLNEKTIGTASDMAEQFSYSVVVEQTTVTNTTPRQYRTRTWHDGWVNDYWNDWGTPRSITNGKTVSTTNAVNLLNTSCVLADGQQETFAVFSDDDATTTDWLPDYGDSHTSGVDRQYQTNYTVTVFVRQTITITQTPKNGFVTTNDGVGGDQQYVYTYTSTGADDEPDQTVTFTNTHVAEPVTFHVAVGQNGSVTNRDDLCSTDSSVNTTTVSNGVDNAVALGDAPEGLFTGDSSVYSPIGLFYGKTNENGVVEIVTNVTSVTFAPLADSPYYGLYINGDNSLPIDGDYGLFYVYCEMPKVYYMKETSNGALTAIDPIEYMGHAVTNMGFGTTTIAQGNVVDVDLDNGTVIAGSGRTNYRVPTLLDGARPEPMNRASYAVGTPGLTNTSAMDGVTTGDTLQIKVIGGVLKWSADGETWNDFSGSPAVYVIYKEVGYDLTINCPSLASEDDRANDTFIITITSDSLVDGAEYLISGYSSETVTPVNGTITLTVTGGSHVVIQSLPNKGESYTVQETLPEKYDLENLTVNGNQPTAQELTEDGNGVNLIMESDTTVEFTTIKNYDVTFVDENGNEISTGTYHYGTDPSKITTPEDPTKPMDETSIYRFDDWGPTIGPVGSNTTYTAEYREIKIPSATQRAVDTNIVVTLDEPGQQPTPEQLKEREEALTNALAAAGIDVNDPNYSEDEANEILNSEDPNGLTRWENLVTGTDTNEPPLSTSVSTDETQMTVQMAADPDPDATVNLGYTMLRDLRKYDEQNKTWNRVAGPEPAGNPAFHIALVDSDGKSTNPTGLYRVYTLLVPNIYQAITNEIPSTNIIGVLEINSRLTNTVVAVPWRELASSPDLAEDITVSNHVSTVNLTDGDIVYALSDASKNGDGKTYEMWTLVNGKWDSGTTIRESSPGSGYSVATEAEAPDRKRFPRTKAVWVQRQNPLDANGDPKPFFLVGQYEANGVSIPVAGGSESEPGYTLISVPSYKDFLINDLDWGGKPVSKDFIKVVDGSSSFLLKWSKGNWCVETPVYRFGRYAGTTYTPYTTPIKAGTGFWICRHGEAFTVTWTPSGDPIQ